MIKKCIGCGSILQEQDINKVGYTSNINNPLCERCFKLKYYGEYQSVNLNNSDYKKIIDSIPENSLVVYITSLLNINLDYVDRFKNVLIVLTKKDLLPKSTKDYKLIDYIKKHTNNYLDIEVVSAVKNYNLDNLLNKIKKYSNNKEIYFVGMTNSGKSTLINSLIKNYTEDNIEITTSIYPSTTLDKITIDLGNVKIIDTPGLLSEKSILNYLSLKEIKKITPKKELKPRSYQISKEASLIIENMLRIDIHNKDNIVIYIANNLNITKIGKDNKKLIESKKYSLKIEKNKDIVIEDLCFIKCQNNINIDIYSFYDVNIYTRDNLI